MNINIENELETIKMAALSLLYEEHVNGRRGTLTLNDVREGLGIPRVGEARDKNSLAHGVLIQLWADGCAEHTGRDSWEITDYGIIAYNKFREKNLSHWTDFFSE